MLYLKRKPGQSVRIGPDVTLTVMRSSRGNVTLAFDAPRSTRILRFEAQDLPEYNVAEHSRILRFEAQDLPEYNVAVHWADWTDEVRASLPDDDMGIDADADTEGIPASDGR